MQNSYTIEDRVLLKKACLGCRGSLSAIYSKYKKAVSDYLKRARADRHSDDLTHNVFIAILDGKCKYDGNGDVNTYLFGIARNICNQDIKQLYGITYDHHIVTVSTQIMASPVAAVEQLELRRDLEAAVAVLPPKPRQAIQLVYFEGKTYQEAAQALGCNYNTVKVTARYEILEPETWIGKELPILQHIDIADQLKTGNWLVVLYHHDCPSCAEAIPKIEQMSRDLEGNEDLLKIALIEVPPYAPNNENLTDVNTSCALDKLDQSKEWFVTTPAIMLTQNNTVLQSWEEHVPRLEELVNISTNIRNTVASESGITLKNKKGGANEPIENVNK